MKNQVKSSKSSEKTKNESQQCDKALIKLVLAAKSGEKSAAEQLIYNYTPKIKAICSKYFLKGADSDDLFQEAMIGFWEAVRDFDQEKNQNFTYFLTLCVTRQLREAARKFDRKKHIFLNDYLPLETLTSDDKKNFAASEDIISKSSDPELSLINKEKADFLNPENISLSHYEKDVLTLYLKGQNYRQIAAILSKTPKSVDNALTRIKQKFKQHMKK